MSDLTVGRLEQGDLGTTLGLLAHGYFGVHHGDEPMRQHHQCIEDRAGS